MGPEASKAQRVLQGLSSADYHFSRLNEATVYAQELSVSHGERLRYCLMMLAHSTVTLLARFLGLSTSQPRATAM